ncbi:tRNA (adenosine(37)-N6)-dimethylallyltransferase MiaA [Fibrella forsythiae]|uniref:tRNA dimethylallyltransferase n=1 Tax=Fibrella forsythiae TaxID=2817061 RepID=A0ABS3JSN6_9BACT|nr:tRNA (adenosine(37)-N6)-dimethylallyltransferase MiaA [Fibrella forsythiae]MBO0952396.1 tRNA (adenosine(37)-N6)-dimethylallyltransferase MiaA [Fibrella forsythiae]
MNFSASKTVIVIAGPTAVGKTTLCVQLAKKLQTVVISADSRQLYREMSIGTAKPSPADLDNVPHYFIDSHSVAAPISAGQYEREALALLNTLFTTYDTVILTGGTGLYINAVLKGLDDMPEGDMALRQALQQQFELEGITPLQNRLLQLDPAYAALADLNNTQRVMRALEVSITTGKPYSSFRHRTAIERPFSTKLIALQRPREELYARIDQRVETMLARGLVDEVQSLAHYRHTSALQTVGYKEVFPYLDGDYDYETMVEVLKRNSRRYAKRQLTWFRHQNQFEWINPDDEAGILASISQSVSNRS